MLICASIIAQPIESQGNKIFLSQIMHGNYAGFARSVVAIADFFARQARAGSRDGGDNGIGCVVGPEVLGLNPAFTMPLHPRLRKAGSSRFCWSSAATKKSRA
jgi:hypothetical protein